MANSMFKRGYEGIARAVKATDLTTADKNILVDNLIKEVAPLNDKFSIERFKRACGVLDGES